MGIMSADEEQHNRNAQEKLFGWGILISAVDLFPHVQVVICAGVELKWYASYPVEHEKGAKHVGDIGKSP